ncbi:MAG: protein kinase domain-containing protein, partial [Limisphaerales bacterium]
YDFGEIEGHFFLMMEFLDGANLRQVIRAGSMSPAEALEIVPRICEALQYAHDQGIVHRDIKPENILLDQQGRVKIADFGLAKLVKPGEEDYTLTQEGMTMGTPRYMAPEQMDAPQDVDHRADVYSLGVVFYEMLTGEVPMGRFAPPSKKVEVDVRLDEVVLRSLERDPELRFQHASEVKSELDTISSLFQSMPTPMRDALGWEYKTESNILGLPLLHVTSGIDPKTGQKRRAKGIVAIGENATGVFAFGTIAKGVFAFGALGIGLFADAGLGVGLFALAGLGIGLIGSYAGLSIAPVAIGGVSIGYYATGGLAFGKNAVGGNGQDRTAIEFFSTISPYWQSILVSALGLIAFAVITPIIVQAWARRRVNRDNSPNSDGRTDSTLTSAQPKSSSPPRVSQKAIWGLVSAVVALLFLVSLAVLPMLVKNDLAMQNSDSVALNQDAWSKETLIATMIALAVPALLGAFISTLLGFLSIHAIRHSEGRLTGLGLAVVDSLFFPLLVGCPLILAIGAFATKAVFNLPSLWTWPALVGLVLAGLTAIKVIKLTWASANRPAAR